jgi:hypothetical protein
LEKSLIIATVILHYKIEADEHKEADIKGVALRLPCIQTRTKLALPAFFSIEN